MGEKVLVSFTDDQGVILNSLYGIMGHNKAEVIRTIVMSWLSQNGYLSKLNDEVKVDEK